MDLDPAVKATGYAAHAEALRWVLAWADAADGCTLDPPAGDLSPDAVAALARLVIGVRLAFAQMRGITDPAEQRADVRALLRTELEAAEMNAMFEGIVAAEGDGG